LQGHTVIAIEKDRSLGLEAVKQLRTRFGSRIWFVHADVSDERAVRRLLKAVAKRFKKVQALINNAGSAGDCPAQDHLTGLDLARFKQLIDDNLTSAFLMSKGVIEEFFL